MSYNMLYHFVPTMNKTEICKYNKMDHSVKNIESFVRLII